MAKNNLVKWIIGATSVAAFTGFIGVAKQFDTTKANAATQRKGTYNPQPQQMRIPLNRNFNNQIINLSSDMKTRNMKMGKGKNMGVLSKTTPETLL